MTTEAASTPSRARTSPASVACFGEVLWDCLPRGLFLGGAPINAAYHLAHQGLTAVPLTAVGRDFLGDEVLRRIGGWGLDTRFVARRPGVPTGTVRATLDSAGVAHYAIARKVAWDCIPVQAAITRLDPPAAIVHGTLALRESPNREALAALFSAWPVAWRVVDLNLRAPFDTAGVIKLALHDAQLVKLNDEELAQLTGLPRHTGARGLERSARRLATHFRVCRVCVTAGARGAGLLWDGDWHWEPARPVAVRDTVGAGDAFLGGLLGALLVRRADPASALASACRMGEFVASRDGATPPYELAAQGLPEGIA